MGIAAPVLGAVGTITQIGQQKKAANAQKAQIEANRLAAQQNYELNRQRFESAKATSEETYLKEKLLLDESRNQATQQLAMAGVQQTIANVQQDLQSRRFSADIANQTSQLLAQADTVEGQAAVANAEVFDALAQRFLGNDQAAREFMQRLALTNQNPAVAEQFTRESILASIGDYQAGLDTVNTQSRAAAAQAEGLRANASINQQYGEAASNFQNQQTQLNREFQEFVRARMPGILELQNQRNQAALQSANYARQAEMNIAQQANSIEFQNQNRIANSQLNAIQDPNILGGITQVAGGFLPYAMNAFDGGSRQQQQSASSGLSFSGPSFSDRFGGSFNSPDVGSFNSSLDFSGGVLNDVRTTIPTFG